MDNMKIALRNIFDILDGRQIRLMEVCGTHTVSISRAGLRALLSPQIELLSGPGCPVCVTPAQDIAKALWIACHGAVVTTFGDMMKVPVGDRSLFKLRAEGYHIEIVYSPLEAVELALKNNDEEIVFIGVGFETTIPAIAGTIIEAQKRGIGNFSILSSLKTIPIPLDIICNSPKIAVDGFILPGHVSAVIGSKPYEFIPERYGKPGVITGFEPDDIIDGITSLCTMFVENKPEIQISYKRVVTHEGNIVAQKLIDKVFEPCNADWRGLGNLPGTGLRIRREYCDFDAESRFDIPDKFPDAVDNPACECANVIMGITKPTQCPLFGSFCTPTEPQGPCMISSEGACAAYYKYES